MLTHLSGPKKTSISETALVLRLQLSIFLHLLQVITTELLVFSVYVQYRAFCWMGKSIFAGTVALVGLKRPLLNKCVSKNMGAVCV